MRAAVLDCCHQQHYGRLARRGGSAPALVYARPRRIPTKRPATLHARALARGSDKVDVVALGNLCVDVVIPVDQLPPADLDHRKDLLHRLTQSPTDESNWEVGGNCNFIIAAARIGMKVASVGHVGSDIYGNFLQHVLKVESVNDMEKIAPVVRDPSLDNTLICFVLVDPGSKHAFCSRYDFGPWPLLSGISSLPENAMQLLRRTRAVFMNGFVFDELPLDVVCNSCQEAIDSGAAIFFDPGPRCFTMLDGSRREALGAIMDLSHVVLMTEEEAKIVTGHSDPELAAQHVLSRPGAKTQWCCVKLGGEGALLRSKPEGKTYTFAGLKVDVQDTVGCGDSFASAIVMGFINNYSIPSTLALANAVGAATATGRGAGRNVASAPQVMSLLQGAVAGGLPSDHLPHAQEAISILKTSLDLL